MNKTYREIWEKACKEGKGGAEDGRPWVDGRARPHNKDGDWVRLCTDCKFCDEENCRPLEDAAKFDFKCAEANTNKKSEYYYKSFFWPSNEPLPKAAVEA
jgi:hypothetical protein